jgi:hypothetical protein
MNNYQERINNYFNQSVAYLMNTKNLWIKEEHPEIIERFEQWDWEASYKKIVQLLAKAYQENTFEGKIGTIAITWDDFYNSGITMYFGSECEYQEWMNEDWLDWEIDLSEIVDQIFDGIDNWYDEMEVELNLFKDLFVGLVEIAAINSVKTDEFQKLNRQEKYLISSTSWHDAEYNMIFNSEEDVAYDLIIRDEYLKTEEEVLEDGYYMIFGEKYHISTRWIRGCRSKQGLIPEEIGLFQNVKDILGQNEYLKSIPESLFSLVTLENLNLSHNKLETISASVGNLKSLKILDVSHNQLNDLPNAIDGLDQLERLNMEYNQLKALPSLGKLPKLKELSAYNNEIETLLELPKNLTWLNLNTNKLKALPESISQLKHLKTLVLSDNFFTSFPEEILKLEALESITIGGNPIEDIPKELLSLPNLKEININPNKFSIEKRKELKELFGDILFVGYNADKSSFM